MGAHAGFDPRHPRLQVSQVLARIRNVLVQRIYRGERRDRVRARREKRVSKKREESEKRKVLSDRREKIEERREKCYQIEERDLSQSILQQATVPLEIFQGQHYHLVALSVALGQ